MIQKLKVVSPTYDERYDQETQRIHRGLGFSVVERAVSMLRDVFGWPEMEVTLFSWSVVDTDPAGKQVCSGICQGILPSEVIDGLRLKLSRASPHLREQAALTCAKAKAIITRAEVPGGSLKEISQRIDSQLEGE